MNRKEKRRCSWVKLNNQIYVDYHDNEWGKPQRDDKYLFEALILETFQAGLSWEIILNKREHFRKAFDNFDWNKIAKYNDKKIAELAENPNIIRNKKKISASVENAKIFIKIRNEFGEFANYIWGFSENKVVKNTKWQFRTTSELSDKISRELKKRGMKFLGSTTIYSYLQAIGVVNDHQPHCDFK